MLNSTDPNSLSISVDNKPAPIAVGDSFVLKGIEFDVKVTYNIYRSGARSTEVDVYALCPKTDSSIPTT